MVSFLPRQDSYMQVGVILGDEYMGRGSDI